MSLERGRPSLMKSKNPLGRVRKKGRNLHDEEAGYSPHLLDLKGKLQKHLFYYELFSNQVFYKQAVILT